MANDLNRWEGIGRLGKDPELRFTPAGDAVCNFSVACSWKTSTKEGTEWVRITTFGKLANICGEYLKKGSQVFVSGRLTTRKWQNKDGIDQYTTEVNADQLQMLGAKPDNVASKQQYAAASSGSVAEMDSDVPF
jgi:single-strand DNA-binding protein